MSTPIYNASEPAGGNPLEVDVNAQYTGVEYNYTYLLFCGAIVWVIIPGLGLLYGGLSHRKSALAMLFQSFLVASITTFQWMFWGYSLAYGRNGGPFIGDLHNFGMMNVMAAPSIGSSTIPEIVFCLYQMFFCACTVMIVVGGAFERGRIVPSAVFGFWWATAIYCPIANWTWNPNGWLYNLPSLDFAGGGPVHISSGWSALAYALILGKRKNHGQKSAGPRGHNISLIFLGTTLIYFGWFGFNGGSALNGSIRAMLAAFNTNTAAATGCIAWVIVDSIKHRGRFSLVGACEGIIAGLVGITPAAGYVSVWPAALIGFVTSVVCNLADPINDILNIDDGLYVFKLHGIGGMCGSFLTGIFATDKISSLDGATIASGGIDGNGIQVGKQFAEITAISSYSFVASCALLLIFKLLGEYVPVPGFAHLFRLRVSEEAELKGLDLEEFILGEDVGDWSLFDSAHGRGHVSHGQKIVSRELSEREAATPTGTGTATPDALRDEKTV